MNRRNVAVVSALVVAVVLVLVATRRKPPPEVVDVVAHSDAASGEVRVTVYDDGALAEDRWVVFHAPDGAVVSVTKTGKDGRASGTIVTGGMVTVAELENTRNTTTVRDLVPGDAIIVGELEEESVATSVCTARVGIPGPRPGASRHVVSLGVGATEMPDAKLPLPLPVLKRFVKDGKFPVLAEALSATGERLGFAFGRFGGCPDGGTLDVTLPAWSSDYRPFEIALHALPAPADATAELWLATGEDRFERGVQKTRIDRDATLKFPSPRVLGIDGGYRVVVDYGTDRAVLRERSRTLPEKIDVDAVRRLLPRVSGMKVDIRNAARPSVAWTALDGGRGDAIVAHVSWPATHEHVWTVITAATTNSFVLPALPAELAALRPDGMPTEPAVAIVEASFYEGYRDVVKKGIYALTDPPEGERTEIRYSAAGGIDF